MALFQSLWIGQPLSPMEVLCIRSFLEQGHSFELYAYNDLPGLPAGCVLRDASSILPEDQVFYYKKDPGKGSPAGFSNLFRYKLLLEKGGWWVDTDVLCLAAAMPEREVALAPEEPARINGAIMKFPPGHPAMAWAFAQAKAAGRNIRFTETGPLMVTRMVQEFELQEALALQQDFYPTHWSEASYAFDPRARQVVEAKISGACFFHLWNEMFRQLGYSKQICPPLGSYLHERFAAYGMLEAFAQGYVMRAEGDEHYLEVLPDQAEAGTAAARPSLGDRLRHCFCRSGAAKPPRIPLAGWGTGNNSKDQDHG